MNTHTTAILALQAPLLNLAYTLTGDRTDAKNLLHDTTQRAMSAPAAFTTRESLFAVMHSIFDASYSARAHRRRIEANHRVYALPAIAESEETVPAGTHAADALHTAIAAIPDRRHSYALAMRAAGYRYKEIARAEGVSSLRIRLRVFLASISLRALLS